MDQQLSQIKAGWPQSNSRFLDSFYIVFENSPRQEYHNFKTKLNILATICIPQRNCKVKGTFLHNIHTFIYEHLNTDFLYTHYLYNKNVHGMSICHCINIEFQKCCTRASCSHQFLLFFLPSQVRHLRVGQKGQVSFVLVWAQNLIHQKERKTYLRFIWKDGQRRRGRAIKGQQV